MICCTSDFKDDGVWGAVRLRVASRITASVRRPTPSSSNTTRCERSQQSLKAAMATTTCKTATSFATWAATGQPVPAREQWRCWTRWYGGQHSAACHQRHPLTQMSAASTHVTKDGHAAQRRPLELRWRRVARLDAASTEASKQPGLPGVRSSRASRSKAKKLWFVSSFEHVP